MTTDKRTEEKQSFIAEARRAQIIEAAIATLDEIGYVNASLARIARKAGISTALISYHFEDKVDLMNHTLMALVSESNSYVLERLKAGKTPRDRLRVFIESKLAYQGTHPKHNNALIEIVFNARTPDNIPYYRLTDEEEDDPIYGALRQILAEGQACGEFRVFDIHVMASAIEGAIGEYPLNPNLPARVDLEAYSAGLVEAFDRAVSKECR